MSEITYNWTFSPLEIVYNEEGLTDVINVVHWQYHATYETSPTSSISQQSIGTVALPAPTEPEGFIPFADVTKEQVTNWVVAAMGEEAVTRMQESLSGSIAYQLHPTKGIVSPPWVDPNPPTGSIE